MKCTLPQRDAVGGVSRLSTHLFFSTVLFDPAPSGINNFYIVIFTIIFVHTHIFLQQKLNGNKSKKSFIQLQTNKYSGLTCPKRRQDMLKKKETGRTVRAHPFRLPLPKSCTQCNRDLLLCAYLGNGLMGVL